MPFMIHSPCNFEFFSLAHSFLFRKHKQANSEIERGSILCKSELALEIPSLLVRRRVVMSWRRVAKSSQGLIAHALLFSFTLLLSFKLDRAVPYHWWIVFVPLWLFHAVVARGRFSLPAPSMPNDRHWAPCHAVMATPLLVAFEILLCIHLEKHLW
uniref:Uncharacterized protein n=1 Tax=Salix viminalis TaxID=40686 RepID=A0A6N2N7E1_SALVM